MKTEDLETYKKDGTKASKSQLKEFIKLYQLKNSKVKIQQNLTLLKQISKKHTLKKFI